MAKQREIYCVKCKAKVSHTFDKGIAKTDKETGKQYAGKKGFYFVTRTSNGRKMARGQCKVCGTQTSGMMADKK